MTEQSGRLNTYYNRPEVSLDEGEKLIREIQVRALLTILDHMFSRFRLDVALLRILDLEYEQLINARVTSLRYAGDSRSHAVL